jgi:hypothetical protein
VRQFREVPSGTAVPEAPARRGAQPERGYNKADGGGFWRSTLGGGALLPTASPK